MKTCKSFVTGTGPTLMAWALCASLVSAQVDAGQDATDTPPKAAPAAPGLHQVVKVTGLRDGNAPAVREALMALTTRVNVCPGCAYVDQKRGSCPRCQKPLERRPEPPLADVLTDVSVGTLTLVVKPDGVLRLSAVDAAMGTHGVAVDRSRLDLPRRVTLLVDAVADRAEAERLATALRKQAAFTSVTLRYDHDDFDDHRATLVVDVDTKAKLPTWTWLQQVVANADPEHPFTLGDVILTGSRIVP